MIKTLRTDRLILRKFRKADLDDFFSYAQNPNVGPNAGWKPHKDKREAAVILDHFVKGDEVWAITLKKNGKVIGSIGLHKDEMRTTPRVKMLGYVLAEEFWGQGIMTEAVAEVIRYGFEELKLMLISVAHYSHNLRSQRVIEKSGFRYEGTLRYSREIFDGSVQDLLCYSLAKNEWED